MDKNLKGMAATDEAVARAIEAEGQPDDHLIRLSTGVVLKAKQANPSILIRVMTSEERPHPPTFYSREMGREMENPDDPDYIKRVQAWEMSYNSKMLDALIGLGTELQSKPKGMSGPNDDEWLDEYKAFGLPTIPNSKPWRYITWVQFKAAVNEKDIALIGDRVKQLSGVPEAAVQSAETFPGRDQAGG